jgi:nucleotide-binding universal stress UspA family protein
LTQVNKVPGGLRQSRTHPLRKDRIMKILLAADGSEYTKKALAFLVTHETLLAPGTELHVINVQPPMPPRVTAMVGASTVADYYRDETARVLEPISKFLDHHEVRFTKVTAIGHAGEEIVRAAAAAGCHMIVMGTHGHGLLGRVLMGSVAQHVVQGAHMPVLLVK